MTVSILHPPIAEQPDVAAGLVVLMSPGTVPEGAEVVGVLVRLPRPATPGHPTQAAPALRPSVPQLGTVKGPRRTIHHGLAIDDAARQVFSHGEPLELTRLEFDLLQHFADHPGRVLTRSVLLSAVWDRDPVWSSSRTVDVHVLRLRRALGEEHSRALQTVRGIGYRWVP